MFEVGTVVRLKSGSPDMTVVYSNEAGIVVAYYNPITGSIEEKTWNGESANNCLFVSYTEEDLPR